jgi:hypothetical protein
MKTTVTLTDENVAGPIVHGIQEAGRHTLLHFGMIRLFEALAATKEEDSPVPEWTKRFHSPVFLHRISHFKQCVEKFNRAARLIDRCRKVAAPLLSADTILCRASLSVKSAEKRSRIESSIRNSQPPK